MGANNSTPISSVAPPATYTMTPEQTEQVIREQEITKEIEEKKAVLDKNMVTSLAQLGELMKQYNRNDIPHLLQNMREKGIKMPSSIVERLTASHSTLLNNIDNVYSEQDKNNKVATDQALAEYLQKDVDEDLENQLKQYMQNPFLSNDPMIMQGVQEVASSIKSIRGKYKFFEYKYLQMNVFLITFINYVNETLTRFVSETSAFYEAKEKYHLLLIKNLVKTFQDQLDIEAKAANGSAEAVNIGDTLKELTQSVIDSIAKQKEFTEKSKQQSLQDILKFLMERESDFAKELVGIVDKYKVEKKRESAQQFIEDNSLRKTASMGNNERPGDRVLMTQSPPQDTISRPVYPIRSRVIPSAFAQKRFNTRFQGGFIRDNSFVPNVKEQSGGFMVRGSSFFPETEYIKEGTSLQKFHEL